MDGQGCDISVTSFIEVEDGGLDTRKSLETKIAETLERMEIHEGDTANTLKNMNFDLGQDNPGVPGLLEDIRNTKDLLDTVESGLYVSNVVSDAVLNGVVSAQEEEFKEALAAKDSENFLLNKKIEDLNRKIWNLEETLQYKEEVILSSHETISERDRLLKDFIHEKDLMQQRAQETEQKLASRDNEMMHMVLEKDNIILSLHKQIELQSQNTQSLDCFRRDEIEDQNIKEEIEKQIVETIYVTQIQELGEEHDLLRLESAKYQDEIQSLKDECHAKEMSKQAEISKLSHTLEESIMNSNLESLFTAEIYENTFRELGDQISQLRNDMYSKNSYIDSLASRIDFLSSECNKLQEQISSNHIIDEEIENNLSTLKASMEMQCSKLKDELEEERGKISENLQRISKLQKMNNELAERSKSQNSILECLQEKLLEQQWQQEIERLVVNMAFGSKLEELTDQINIFNSVIDKKEAEVSGHLDTISSLQTVLSNQKFEIEKSQKVLQLFESHIDKLVNDSLHEVDSAFCSLNSRFYSLIHKVDNSGETLRAFVKNIQNQVAVSEEQHIEHQCKEELEGHIADLVLNDFSNDILSWSRRKEEAVVHDDEFDAERIALLNELKSLHQDLELLKAEEAVKSLSNNVGVSTKGIHYFSQLIQEGKDGEASDGQGKSRALRRHSTGQAFREPPKPEDLYTTYSEGKIVEPHPTEEKKLLAILAFETADASDSPLRNWPKEQLLGHFKQSLAGLKREYELELQRKTEEIYDLKRLLLNEKNGLHAKKEKDLNILKKKVAEITGKFEKVLQENKLLPVEEVQRYKMLCVLKEELQSKIDSLLKEIKEKDSNSKVLAEKLSDALKKSADHAQRESHLLKHIADLEAGITDREIMTSVCSDVLTALFVEMVREKEFSLSLATKEQETVNQKQMSLRKMLEDKDKLLCLVCEENKEHKRQIAILEKLKEETENNPGRVFLQSEEREKIEEQKRVLDQALQECEELKNDIQNKHSDIDSLREEQEKLNKQLRCMKKEMEEKEVMLSEKLSKEKEISSNLDSMQLELRNYNEELKNEIEKKSTDIHLLIKEKEELNERLAYTQKAMEQKESLLVEKLFEGEQKILLLESSQSATREQTEKYRDLLNSLTEEHADLKKQFLSATEELQSKERDLEVAMTETKFLKEKLLVSDENLKEKDLQLRAFEIANSEKQYQTYQLQMEMECLQVIIQKMHKLECTVSERIQSYISRIMNNEKLLQRLRQHYQAASVKESNCRKKLQTMCHNLQKAEEEVDLLGDEVDSLLSLLEKVYVALNHYSPVLQHYPGMLELAKMIKKETTDHFRNQIRC